MPSGDHETVYSLLAPRWMKGLFGTGVLLETGVLECFGIVMDKGCDENEMTGERIRSIVNNAAPPPAITAIPTKPLRTTRREIPRRGWAIKGTETTVSGIDRGGVCDDEFGATLEEGWKEAGLERYGESVFKGAIEGEGFVGGVEIKVDIIEDEFG